MYGTALLAAALAAPLPAGVVGETLHYVRSNADGSRPEQIYMHRAAADRIEVYKMVSRCTHAALVTATIDPVTGEASRLEAAGLLPNAGRQPYGEMRFDPATATIRATLTIDDRGVAASARVDARPWHLYDYDLATRAAAFRTAQPERTSFGLALVWVEAGKDVLRWLGRADAVRGQQERRGGRAVWRYEVGGPAFGTAGGGPMWIDRRDGTLVEARWKLPNHQGYRDFRLRLVGAEAPGAAAWTALLTRHFRGCPPLAAE